MKLRQAIDELDFRGSGKWMLLATVVGVLVGMTAIVFHYACFLVNELVLIKLVGYEPPDAAVEPIVAAPLGLTFHPWLLVPAMTIGGLVSGWLVHRFAPEAEGSGVDAAIDAFHNERGQLRKRIPWVKTVASAITLGTGGSAGREGPIALIGAATGSWLGQQLKLSARDTRILLATGMGAGVGAMFRAPLAGAVFAGEILYSEADFESDAILPAAIGSIVGYSVYIQMFPPELQFMPLFGTELTGTFGSPLQLVAYALLAVLLSIGAAVYVRVLHAIHESISRISVAYLRPAIGAGMAAAVALFGWAAAGGEMQMLAVLGTGYGFLQQALTGAADIGIWLLLAVALLKVITTALTVGSGGSGGVFAPSMVIGGSLGAAVGLGLEQWLPGLAIEPGAAAVVGMAGFFAGVARTPISTIIMVRALTGSYELLVPTMLVSTLTFLLCRSSRIYRKQVPTRLESAAHRGDFLVDLLEGLRVEDVYRRDFKGMLVPESMTLDEIVHRLAGNQQRYFPVVDKAGRMVGIFSDNDVRSYLYDDTLWQLAVARDIMTASVLTVSPPDDLNTAMQRFTQLNLDEIPVVDPDDGGRLLGLLRRKEVIAAYNQRLMQHKQAVSDAG